VAAVTPATAEAAVTSATAKAAVTTTAAAVTAVATTRETRPERHLRAEDWGQW
jgi:hypothetical protein